jgi:prephenate dehydratase
MKGYAIQGFEGCFHQMAAQRIHGEGTKVIHCATFTEVVQLAANTDRCDGGLMAIENSIAGSILPNYNLLNQSKLYIIGETYLKIEQHLITLPGVSLEEIEEVHSHPMALQQCTAFLEQHSWKLVETVDTALSAKWLHDHQQRNVGVIAGELAAKLYGLQITGRNVHTMPNNYTRFLLLSSTPDYVPNANKASVYFETDHTRGSLAKALTSIAEQEVNVSKLQSIPVPGSDWRYGFYADLEFEERKQLETVYLNLTVSTASTKLQGIYKSGKNGNS